jgi:hypothetical protein
MYKCSSGRVKEPTWRYITMVLKNLSMGQIAKWKLPVLWGCFEGESRTEGSFLNLMIPRGNNKTQANLRENGTINVLEPFLLILGGGSNN